MAEEPQVPAQPEGASQPTKKKAQPVNLAMVEAAERGIDLSATPPPPPARPAASKQQELDLTAEAPAAEAPVEPAPAASDEPETPAVPDGAPSEAIAPTEAPMEEDPNASPREALEALAAAGGQKRLSPRDEDRATALLRTCLSTGETAAALAAMPKLPWILGVRAIEQAWTQLSAEGRTDLLNSLGALEGEHAIRLRLSVARSLAKLDPPVGVELAGSVCRTMWDAENGALSADHSKLIGNVFIGRGKPWILQLNLDGLNPADAQAIVSCAVFSAFNVNNPPITQLSVLRYAGARLANLHPNLLAMVGKGVGRWSGKWQESLRKEIADLPETILGALKTARPARTDAEPTADAAPEVIDEEVPLPPELEEKLKLAVESGDAETVAAVTLEVNAWRDAHPPIRKELPAEAAAEGEDAAGEETPKRNEKGNRRGRDRDRNERGGRNERQERGDRGDRGDRKERPVYVSREQEAATKGQGPFNLSSALKQIENHVAQLRNELSATQSKLRKAESAGNRRTSDKVMLSVEEANLSPDELKRLVLQLEQRNQELQLRVEELLADSEMRAIATAADADVTVQYRSLLKLKLQEDYNDYLALEKNAPEYVVQQHYRSLIRHVFGVLRTEGVELQGDLPPPPPEPLPPPPPPPVIEDEEEEEDSPLDRIDEEAAADSDGEDTDEDADDDVEAVDSDDVDEDDAGDEPDGEESGEEDAGDDAAEGAVDEPDANADSDAPPAADSDEAPERK